MSKDSKQPIPMDNLCGETRLRPPRAYLREQQRPARIWTRHSSPGLCPCATQRLLSLKAVLGCGFSLTAVRGDRGPGLVDWAYTGLVSRVSISRGLISRGVVCLGVVFRVVCSRALFRAVVSRGSCSRVLFWLATDDKPREAEGRTEDLATTLEQRTCNHRHRYMYMYWYTDIVIDIGSVYIYTYVHIYICISRSLSLSIYILSRTEDVTTALKQRSCRHERVQFKGVLCV